MEPKPKKYVRIEYKTARTSHHVCFKCRKQFCKRVDGLARVGLTGQMLESRFYDRGLKIYPCPQCAQPMTHIGKNFRAPQQDDVEGWEVARRLSNAGFRYDHTSGPYPTKLREVATFIENNRRKDDGEQLLDKWKAADK